MPSEGRARIVAENVDAWITRWKIVEGATQSLDVQYFIIEPDVFGLAFLGLLHEKRGQGVELRLMVDSRGTPGLTRAFAGLHLLSEMAGAGAEVRAYNTIETQLGTFARGAFRNVVASNHDKLIIADGRTSLLGGRNIAADYLSDPRDRPTAFIDVDVVIEGRSVAAALTRAFATELHATNAISVKARRSDDDRDMLDLATRLMRAWLSAPALTDQEIAQLRDPTARSALAMDYEGRAVSSLGHIPSDRVRAVLRKLTEQLAELPRLRGAFRSGATHATGDLEAVRILDTRSAAAPAMHDRVTENILVAIDAARTEVLLQSPYLILSEHGLRTLERAAQRGVAVTFLTNSPVSSDSPMAQAAFLDQWPEVLARVPTARLYVIGIERVMHAKVVVIDGELSFVGSYNLDPISAHVNGEVVSVVWSEVFANDLRKLVTDRMSRGPPEVLEYTLERDADGVPRRDASQQLVVGFGPEDHSDPASLVKARSRKLALAVLTPFF